MLGQVVNSDVFVLEKLMYFPMGAHVPIYNRPFTVNASEDALNIIHDRICESKSGVLTGSIVGSVMGQLIQPNAVGEQTLINNDWVTQPRYIFLLKVVTIDAVGSKVNSYIQGYTQYDGINPSTGSIDTNLLHEINNVIETVSMDISTPLGVLHKEKLYKVYNVFASHSQEFYTQRPTDVVDNISLLSATMFLNDGGGNVTSTNLGNHINAFNNSVITSSIDNNIGSEYLCKILNAGMQVQKTKSIFLDSHQVSEETAGGAVIVEPSINDNRFIKYISRQAGFMTVRENFTFSQLMNIDASIYERFQLINPTKNYINPLLAATPETGDYWNGQDPVTLKAYSLIESSVALAMKYGFNQLYFTVSNMSDPTGMASVFITNFKSFIDLTDHDFAYLLEIFKSKFITDVFLGETFGGTVPLHAEVYVDLLGTTKIFLNYGGFNANWYTIPTTANSLFSPVLTVDGQTLDMVTVQFDGMINALANTGGVHRNFY